MKIPVRIKVHPKNDVWIVCGHEDKHEGYEYLLISEHERIVGLKMREVRGFWDIDVDLFNKEREEHKKRIEEILLVNKTREKTLRKKISRLEEEIEKRETDYANKVSLQSRID